MDLIALTLALSNSRTLAYAIYGSTSLMALITLYFHGTPSSRPKAAILSSSAIALNVRIIEVNCPSIGLSPFQATRKILNWPLDITELANYLNLQTFSILAYSSGSVYAFVCAKTIPSSRLLNVEIMAGVYPLKWDGLALIRPLQHLMTSGLTKLAGSSINSQ